MSEIVADEERDALDDLEIVSLTVEVEQGLALDEDVSVKAAEAVPAVV